MSRVQRRTVTDLRRLARDLVTNKLFVARTPYETENCFGLILMLIDDWRPGEAESVGLIYGYLADTFPYYMNGLPMFYACGFIHINDVVRFNKIVSDMQEALQ